jgi:hypothetical protein
MRPIDSLRAASADRLAAQWAALGGQLDTPLESGVVDLEALLAATARLGPAEARVAEAAVAWCTRFGSVINVARFRRVAAELGAAESIGPFAAAVRTAGGPAWPFGDPGTTAGAWAGVSTRGKVVVRDLAGLARLNWRLRAGFGLNARADILADLLTAAGPKSVAELAASTRFGKRNVADAIADMALAGLVEVERVGNRDRVRLAPDAPVRSWLPPDAPPPVDWSSRWRVVLEVLALEERIAAAPIAVRIIEQRAAVEALRADILAAGLPRPDTTATGTAFAEAYEDWVALVAVAVAA